MLKYLFMDGKFQIICPIFCIFLTLSLNRDDDDWDNVYLVLTVCQALYQELHMDYLIQLGCKLGDTVVSIFMDVETEFQEVKYLTQGQNSC